MGTGLMIRYRITTDDEIPEGVYEYRKDPYGGSGGSLAPVQQAVDPSCLDPMKVAEAASKVAHASVDQILGLGRKSQEVLGRALVVYALRDLGGWSYPRIGEFIDRDHTSVMHLCSRVPALTTIPQRQRMRLFLGLES